MREAAIRLKAEQERTYNEINQLVADKNYMQMMNESRHQVQEYLKKSVVVREVEAALALNRAILEEAQRRVEAGERQIQSQRLELTEL